MNYYKKKEKIPLIYKKIIICLLPKFKIKIVDNKLKEIQYYINIH